MFFSQTFGVSRRFLITFGSSEWCNGVQLSFICQGYAIKEDAEWLPWFPPNKNTKTNKSDLFYRELFPGILW